MTAKKFNPVKYRALLADALPVAITNEEEHARMLALVEPMFGRSNLSPEEGRLFDLLVKLLQAYEDEHHPIDRAAPHEVLQHLMEARDLRQTDLVQIFGSSGRVSEAVNGKREISKSQAKALARFFRVSPEMFL